MSRGTDSFRLKGLPCSVFSPAHQLSVLTRSTRLLNTCTRVITGSHSWCHHLGVLGLAGDVDDGGEERDGPQSPDNRPINPRPPGVQQGHHPSSSEVVIMLGELGGRAPGRQLLSQGRHHVLQVAGEEGAVSETVPLGVGISQGGVRGVDSHTASHPGTPVVSHRTGPTCRPGGHSRSRRHHTGLAGCLSGRSLLRACP